MKTRKNGWIDVLIGGILWIVVCYLHLPYLLSTVVVEYTDRRFLEVSFWKQGVTYPYFASTLTALYTGMLKLLFWFGGNREELVAVLQAVLLILTVWMIFSAIRKLWGIWVAAAATLGMIVFMQEISLLTVVTPGNLLLFLTSFYCLSMGSALRHGISSRRGIPVVFGFVGTGIVSGVIGALDSFGLLIFLSGVLLIVLTKKVPVGFLLGNVIGCLVIGIGKIELFGLELLAPVWEYENTYFMEADWNPVMRWGMSSLVAGCVLAIFTLLGIGFTIRYMVLAKKASAKTKKLEIPDIAVKDIESMPVPKTRVIVEEEVSQTKEINYIENPLPVPKRHVKKEMTYAFEPDEVHMCFDLQELPEDADYDVE